MWIIHVMIEMPPLHANLDLVSNFFNIENPLNTVWVIFLESSETKMSMKFKRNNSMEGRFSFALKSSRSQITKTNRFDRFDRFFLYIYTLTLIELLLSRLKKTVSFDFTMNIKQMH